MQKKIVINFKTGKVKTYGKIEQRHIDLARAKLFRERLSLAKRKELYARLKNCLGVSDTH